MTLDEVSLHGAQAHALTRESDYFRRNSEKSSQARDRTDVGCGNCESGSHHSETERCNTAVVIDLLTVERTTAHVGRTTDRVRPASQASKPTNLHVGRQRERSRRCFWQVEPHSSRSRRWIERAEGRMGANTGK